LSDPGGERSPRRLVGAWRLFFLACEELWGWNHGRTWYVSHYLLEPRRR